MAKGAFKFRYQSILDFNQQQQKALEIELARIDGEVLGCTEALRRWQRARGLLLDRIAAARRDGDLLENANCARYLRHVRRQIEHHSAALEGAQQARERAREQLEQAMRSCKALENYRDRLQRQFAAERERAEEKIIDLHSTSKYTRTEEAM